MKSFDKLIPPHRMVVYAIILSMLPVIMASMWTHSVISTAEADRAMLVSLGEKIQRKGASQEANRLLIQRFRNKDPLFLHKKLEPLSLLGSETSILRARLARSALPDDNQIERRLNSLTADNNLCFIEGSTEVSPVLKETLENQNKPVEVDTPDLIQLFTLLEDQDGPEDLQKPHLIISEARIERKKGMFQQTWGLTLKVIRREYL